MTNPHEFFRQSMEKKTPDKFIGFEGDGLFFIIIFTIAIGKCNCVVFYIQNPII